MKILFPPAIPKFNKLGCSRSGTSRLWFQLSLGTTKLYFMSLYNYFLCLLFYSLFFSLPPPFLLYSFLLFLLFSFPHFFFGSFPSFLSFSPSSFYSFFPPFREKPSKINPLRTKHSNKYIWAQQGQLQQLPRNNRQLPPKLRPNSRGNPRHRRAAARSGAAGL